MMEPTTQPSPYFIRRTARPETPAIELREFSVVEDQVSPLRDYWLIVKRHCWLIVICALAVFTGTVIYTFTRTPLYTSEATLLIERRAPQILKVQDTRREPDDYNDEFYKTQYEIMKSRTLAERIIRDQGLEDHPVFGGRGEASVREGLDFGVWKGIQSSAKGVMPAKPAASGTEPIPLSTQLAGSYVSMLEVRPVGGTGLVVIKITTPDPALSVRLANAHATAYVRYGSELRSQTNSEAGKFLQQKLAELKERVEQSEAALNSYRKEKGIISVDDKSNVIVDRLLDLNKGLTAAEGERITWEAQVHAARGRNAEEVPSVRSSGVISGLKGDLGRLEAEYASLAKEFKPGYPALDNVKVRIEETRRRLSGEIDREIKSIEAGYAAASNKEANLRAVMEEQKRATLSLKDSAVHYTILAREVDTNKQLYDGVLSRLKEIGIAAEVPTANIHVMGTALPPGMPSYPNTRKTMMLGLFLGLAAGIGLAFLLEKLDNTLKTAEEAERYLRLPNLGMVPDFASVNGTSNGFVSKLVKSAQAELPLSARSRKGNKDSHHEVVLDHNPRSVITEAYRSFRSALLLSQAGGPPHTILITSAARGDGKTTTLINTAVVFAQLGIRVLIIDADLRRPRCHTLLRIENTTGLSDLLAGQIEFQKAIKPTRAENLFLISAGNVPPNPAELLGSEKMYDLLQQLREQFEFIFVDSCPLLAVSDSVLLSTMVDGTLLVVNSTTPKPLVKKARARLTEPYSKLLGTLLNRADMRKKDYGGFYQQYYTYYPADALASGETSDAFYDNGGAGSSGKAFALSGNGKLLRRSSRNGKSSTAAYHEVTTKPRSGLPSITFIGVLDVVRTTFNQAMGPMASLIICEHVRALGESPESFPPTRVDELVRRLGNEISTESLRQRFVSETEREINKLQHEEEKSPNGKSPVVSYPHMTLELREQIVSRAVLDTITTSFCEIVGPMAPFVLYEHIHNLGETRERFPSGRLEELVNRLRNEIATDSSRERFERALSKIENLGAYHLGTG